MSFPRGLDGEVGAQGGALAHGALDGPLAAELLDAGADDYVRKPFKGQELVARVRAVMRRLDQRRVRSGWQLDRGRHEIRWRDQPLNLTATEFRLARRLIERLGELVEHDELLAYAWPNVPDPDQLWLKPHLARLRDKLRAVGAPVPVAVRGVGYRLDAEASGED